MKKKDSQPTAIERIYTKIFELLEESPDGIRWTDLLKAVQESDATLHPKTINGYIWKLTEKYPDKVYKPSRGLFRLVKYK